MLSTLALLLAGCAVSGGTDSGRGTPIPPATLAVTVTPTAASPTGYPVKVYFTKFPEANDNLQAVAPVDRISPTAQVETFSLQLLIAGPTPEERAAGYVAELNGIFSGPSRCPAGLAPVDGPDFTLALNKKGTTPEQGTATVRFCRATAVGGVGGDARTKAEITATLLQFATIKKVVILDLSGHCFGDESGQDLCLK
jgi:hypothetical protein